jgi:hypothetical protein
MHENTVVDSFSICRLLAQDKVAANNGAKLCRKLDRQLGNLALGM